MAENKRAGVVRVNSFICQIFRYVGLQSYSLPVQRSLLQQLPNLFPQLIPAQVLADNFTGFVEEQVGRD